LYSLVRAHSHSTQAKVFRSVISTVIGANVIIFILSTDQHIYGTFPELFHLFEAFSSILFSLEYVLRLMTIHESRTYASYTRTEAVLAWVFSAESIIDIVAFAPFFLEPILDRALPSLAFLRVLRLVRLMKANKFMQAFSTCARVLYFNSEILMVSMTICVFLMLSTATLLYYLRPVDNEDFSSIPATIFLSVMMLTGQGGPEGTLPWYTKVICAGTAFFSVAIFAIPASMLTWGFEAEAERLAKKAHARAGMEKNVSEDVSSDSSEDTEDEWSDYEKVIAGDDDDDDGDDGDSAVLRASIAETSMTDAVNRMEQRMDAMETMLQQMSNQLNQLVERS